MKILLITKLYPGYKNQSREEMTYAIHYFAKEWIKQGHEVEVIRVWPKYPTLVNKFITKQKDMSNETFQLEGVKVHRLTINKIPKIDYFKRDINALYNKTDEIIQRGSKPDVVVCHAFNPGLYIGAKLKEKYNVPLVLTMHKTDINNLSTIPNRRRKFEKLIGSVDNIGFRSKVLYERFQNLNIRNDEGFVIPSGIDEDLIIEEEYLVNKKKSDVVTIFTAAKMVKDKNIDVLIKAFSEVLKENPHIQLNIAGGGPEKDTLEKLVDQLNIKSHVKFLGFISRNEVLAEMEKAHIFAMVSSNETFGLVYIEAMAKGCITIGSKGEGIDGVIKGLYNGCLCEPKNITSLKKILISVISMKHEEKSIIIDRTVETAKVYTQKKISESYLKIISDSNTVGLQYIDTNLSDKLGE